MLNFELVATLSVLHVKRKASTSRLNVVKRKYISNPNILLKMLYFDHRGMGLSTPITAATVAHLAGPNAADQANFLKQFRADSAVKDLEAIRQCLTADFPTHLKKWSVMGQSYG